MSDLRENSLGVSQWDGQMQTLSTFTKVEENMFLKDKKQKVMVGRAL